MKYLSYFSISIIVIVLQLSISLPYAGRGIAQAESDKPLPGTWQLFVDDLIISSKINVSRSYHQFKKSAFNPVLQADRPWESNIASLFGGTVLPKKNGTGYRIWYNGINNGHYSVLYAESEDGIRWRKPNLGLNSFQGSTENNIVGALNAVPSVIYTPWATNPEERYKVVSFVVGTDRFYGYVSQDGLQWKRLDVPSFFYASTGNFVWDPHNTRYYGTPRVMATVGGFSRRCVGISFSDDFIHWSKTALALVPDMIDDDWATQEGQRTEFYGSSAFPYEAGYVGFLWVFRITDGNNDGPIYPELISSRDGFHWVRQEPVDGTRTALLPLGPDGSWDDGMIFTPTHPLVTGETMKLWYGGYSGTHGTRLGKGSESNIGLATLRKDGFASLNADRKGGVVTTRRFFNSVEPVFINADAKRGWIRVEVLNDKGETVPGYGFNDSIPIRSDGINTRVAWKKHMTLPKTEGPISMRFIMKRASLYSFTAGEVEWSSEKITNMK